MSKGGPGARAVHVVLVWVALLVLGAYALGVVTGWALWPR